MTVLLTRDFPGSVLSVLGSLSAGCVFLVAGILKLLSPSAFLRHIAKLNVTPARGLPPEALPWIAGFLAAAECVLGVALLVRMFPDRVFPLSIGVLLIFGAVTIWGRSTGRVDNCACYGDLFGPTLLQSTLLTILYTALIAMAWWLPVAFTLTPLAQKGVLTGSVAFFAGAAIVSMWSHVRFGEDLLNTSPVKPRRRWNPGWLEGFAAHANRRTQLVILITPGCPVCKRWIQPLNKISRRSGMPQLIAGMAAEGVDIDGFKAEFSVEFPLLPVKTGTMARLVRAVPTVVMVEDGVIGSVNVGKLPTELIDQLRE